VGDSYTWSSSGTAPDGTAFTTFLNTLNGGATGVGNCVNNGFATTGGFDGHCDWRLPTIDELETIIDLSAPGCLDASRTNPCIDPIFGPTQPNFYWSSTTDANNSTLAWGVEFQVAGESRPFKSSNQYVRAVRGGP